MYVPRQFAVDDAVVRELRITRIEAKAELSQNRQAADVDGVIEGLAAEAELASAADVRRSRSR